MTHNPDYGTPPSPPAPLPASAPPERPAPARRLHRSRGDRVIAGVCGGLAEYFGVDAVVLRIVAVALALSGGAGIPLYVVAWIVMPEDPEAGPAPEYLPEPGAAPSRAGAATIVGAALVALGGLLLIGQVLPWASAAVMWPLVVIAGGVAVLVSGRRRP